MPTYDLEAIKAKINKLSNNGSYGKKGSTDSDQPKIKYYKPKLGNNTVRFLPYKDSNGNIFHSILYYNSKLLSERRFVAPVQWDLPDPINDFLVEASKTRQPTEIWKFMQKITPQESNYAFLIDREAPEEGVQVWELNSDKVLKIYAGLTNPDFEDEDLFHADTGHDWLVTVTETDKVFNGHAVKSFDIRPRVKPSKLAKTKDEAEKLIASIPDMDANQKRWVKNPESLRDMLENARAAMFGASAVQADSSDSLGASRGGSSSEASNEVQQSVDDAFADL